MYPQLITYLRLTCFDQLGQPSNWMTFDNWLKSKKKKNEREQIISKIKYSDNLEFTQKIFQEYQKIYSVKKSFYRFLSDIIPNNTRLELFNKIKIRINNDTSPTLEEIEVTDKDKEDYLYRIRNDYTHNTYSKGPIKNLKNKRVDDNWNYREILYHGKKRLCVLTHKSFEDKLKETVLIGFAEIIKKR